MRDVARDQLADHNRKLQASVCGGGEGGRRARRKEGGGSGIAAGKNCMCPAC